MSSIFDIDLIEESAVTKEQAQGMVRAVNLVKEAAEGSIRAQARLEEAITTSDFFPYFNRAVDVQVASTFKQTEPEWRKVADSFTTPDLREVELQDMSGINEYNDVAEGEEYKGDTLAMTGIRYHTAKTGLAVGFTYEDFLNRNFEKLANMPARLVQAARNTEDRKVFSALLKGDGDGVNTDFFTGEYAPESAPLTAENLEKAITKVSLRTDFGGNLIDTTRMVLVVHPALRLEAERIVNAPEWEVTVGNRKTRENNPFRGTVTVVAPRALASLNKNSKAATTWFLLPETGSSSPALAHVGLSGHENPDLRYKADQGNSIGGGTLGMTDGAFKDDTVWFRGRHFTNGALLHPNAVYVSNGA